MPRHIKRIIELKGVNQYREGKDSGDECDDIRPYVSQVVTGRALE